MNKSTILRRVAAHLGAGILVLGVAGTVSAQYYDVARGEYLTDEEFKKLSKEEALRYCEELAQEIDIQNDNAAHANQLMTDIDTAIRDLKRELAEAREANRPLEEEIGELERELRELQELPRAYTVVKDDWLMKIARKPRIYGDGYQWPRIYRKNKDQIKDPDLIYPGQVFLIPRGLPTTHTVVKGENLRTIAAYREIYGDRSQWTRIYEANRDKILDPDNIEPGIVLTIPR